MEIIPYLSLQRITAMPEKILVEYLQNTEAKKLREEYKRYFDAMCNLMTEKQAMAMACILLADRILTEVIFTDEGTVKDQGY